MYVIETNNLTKKYKGVSAVDKVNMHIEEGDIYGFVGENGAGKTTIIRLLSGLATPTSGTYSIYGIDYKKSEILTARKRMNGIVETVSLNKSMTALQNLQFQRSISCSQKSDEQLIQLIENVGLDYVSIKERKVGNFSLGMRQRLGIAMTLVSNPSFIILDEPMNGLDPQGFVEVRETILKLNQQGITFLISSHILSELDKICNKIGFISHGILLEEISMEALHNKSRKRILVETEDMQKLQNVLQSQGFTDFEIEQNKCSIYDDIDINKLIALLVNNEIEITNLNVVEDTIEGHYFTLLKRGNS